MPTGSAKFVQSSEKEIKYCGEILTHDPSIYTIDHLDLTASNFMGCLMGPKMVKVS